MNNSKNDYLSFAYGLAIVAGGLIGYFTAGKLNQMKSFESFFIREN